jgi:putative ABC transport system permease protein
MTIAGIRMWFRALFDRRDVEAKMDGEMRMHLELETEANVRRGMEPALARRAALIAFRGVDRHKEDFRDALGTRVIEESWRDLQYAARLARRSPAFTVTALLLLALAVGTASAIFSVAYSVLLRPLPYRQPEQLVFLQEGNGGISWPNFVDWRARATSFTGIAGSVAGATIVTGRDTPLRLNSKYVTANFFHVLGVTAARGRVFDDADARADAQPAVVISHELWMREFGGDPAAVGKTLSLSRGPSTVIGVLPAGFRYMTPADLYLPLEPLIALTDFNGMKARYNHTGFYGVARLQPDVTVETAQAEMRAIALALVREYPVDNKNGVDVPVVPLLKLMTGSTAPTLEVLAGAVALLLLIACINVASLLLNRTASRAHEFGVRAAIGGSRRRLIRQLLTEQALFCVSGGLLGAVAGFGLLAALVRLAPADLPRLNEIHLDVAVLALTAGFACALSLALGMMPALRISGIGGGALALRVGKRSTATSAARRVLMMAEIAVATVLLFGAGLMVNTMVRLSYADPGFDPRGIRTFGITFAGPGWSGPDGDARKEAFFAVALERLRAVPGVENATLAYSLPVQGSNWWSQFTIIGRRAPAVGDFGPNSGMVPVASRYFETLRIPLVEGRYFDATDGPSSPPVAIINSALARRFWPNENPIGQQIRGGALGNEYGPVRRIVGVVGDMKYHGVDQEAPYQMFLPIAQAMRSPVFVIVRVQPATTPTSLEAVIHAIDRSLPVYNDRTFDEVLREASARRRFAMILLSLFGGVAVLLSGVGLYGVIAQSVRERYNEIGIRMSLGASQRAVVGMFVTRGMISAGAGLIVGLAAAVAASRGLESLVFGLTTTDPWTIGAVASLLTAVALTASYIPARSASRIDPLRALRAE